VLPAYEGRRAFGDLAERGNRAGLARWITGRKETRFPELGLDAGRVAEILRLFPDAQFVHLVRDGRDCVASLLGMPWWHRGFHEAVATWAQVVDATRKYARELGPDSWCQLRF
jgi:hypothetical protein